LKGYALSALNGLDFAGARQYNGAREKNLFSGKEEHHVYQEAGSTFIRPDSIWIMHFLYPFGR
jgi:hypothetical protein